MTKTTMKYAEYVKHYQHAFETSDYNEETKEITVHATLEELEEHRIVSEIIEASGRKYNTDMAKHLIGLGSSKIREKVSAGARPGADAAKAAEQKAIALKIVEILKKAGK